MKRRLIIAGIAAALSLLPAAAVGAAANPGNEQSANSNNCIAEYSAQVTQNGQYPTLGSNAAHGVRGDEIKDLQASCGAQS
jgi:hypothetical protein